MRSNKFVDLIMRIVNAVELIASSCADYKSYIRGGGSFRDAAWLTVKEASERGRFHLGHIYKLIDEKRLYVHGERGGYRIRTQHFDAQLALGFPVLDFVSQAEAVGEIMKDREVWLPAPLIKQVDRSRTKLLPVPKNNGEHRRRIAEATAARREVEAQLKRQGNVKLASRNKL